MPKFVIGELQGIADSSDRLRRGRGRRGLDILNRLRTNPDIELVIYERDLPEFAGLSVDLKLVALAKHLQGKLITNDYNLNKVARLQGVAVINLNDLANALKPVFLPGERIDVRVVKAGEEPGQGVGYLEDGTMVVVEAGRDHINQTVPVAVTSVLQTSAGRMVFGKLENGGSASRASKFSGELFAVRRGLQACVVQAHRSVLWPRSLQFPKQIVDRQRLREDRRGAGRQGAAMVFDAGKASSAITGAGLQRVAASRVATRSHSSFAEVARRRRSPPRRLPLGRRLPAALPDRGKPPAPTGRRQPLGHLRRSASGSRTRPRRRLRPGTSVGSRPAAALLRWPSAATSTSSTRPCASRCNSRSQRAAH